MTDELFTGFLDDYYAECEEHLTGARAALLALESLADQPGRQRRVIDELFRFFHSLKGISAMVELRPAEHLAHGLEDYLRAVRTGELSVTPDGISLLIDGTQLLERIVNAHRAKHELPAIDDVLERISDSLPRAEHAAALGEPRPETRRSDRTESPSRDSGNARSLRRASCSIAGSASTPSGGGSRKSGRSSKRLPSSCPMRRSASRSSSKSTPAWTSRPRCRPIRLRSNSPERASRRRTRRQPPPTLDLEGNPARVALSHVVRVDLTRLDELMRQVGDLVISRARLLDSLSRIEPYVPAAEWRDAQENAVAIDRQLRALREGLMRVRLVPVGEIFRRMPFVVRDLARETGRKVTLLLQGQSTEIDKYLIERMMDPVLHLVRNAVSHGIEPPDERIRLGKRPEGTITLSASAAGELVTIDISDDGRGVDTADVAARARQAGLPVPAGQVDSATVLALLCSPGFSTKDDTDRASGRGVGMSVVKETVERLSGTITLDSEPGQGTRFTIQLPLTLAIADALIGRVGAESFAVPQSAVREAIEVVSADVRQIEGNEIVPYRQGSLAIVRLARLFGIGGEPPARFHVFVISTGTSAIGIAVDRIVGQREIVVRTIADPLVRVEGISGATDLGDGKVVLIIDPTALARAVRQRTARSLGAAAAWGRIRA